MDSASGFWISLFDGAHSRIVYPPFLLILIPVGVVLVIRFWWHSGWFSIIWGAIAGGLAYATVFDRLWGIYYDNYRTLDCANLTCPDKYNSLALSTLALWEEIPHFGLSISGIQGGGWILFPLVLFSKRWRWEGLMLGVLAVVGALLSLGPCPASEPTFCGGLSGLSGWNCHFSPYGVPRCTCTISDVLV